MRSKSKEQQPVFDELYLLRLDTSGRPRGARFAKLEDKVASAAVDMKCRALIYQPRSVCRLAMELPEGRLYGGKLVMPRIRRGLYDKILRAAGGGRGKKKNRDGKTGGGGGTSLKSGEE